MHALYGPLLQQALAEWGTQVLYLALDTSMLWETYCLVRIALVYRGRAIPIVWVVLEHPSSSVAYDVYKGVLDKVAELLPFRCRVVLTADRGFADTHLMQHLTRLGWHWRIRLKGSFWIYRQGKQRCKRLYQDFQCIMPHDQTPSVGGAYAKLRGGHPTSREFTLDDRLH